MPLIETNHYQHFHMLIIAKALQARGAEVKVLICGQTLAGCEVKSIHNERGEDPCWKCRFNERNGLPLFNLDVVRLSDCVSASELEMLKLEAGKLSLSYPAPLVRYGVDLTPSIRDSVTRYYFGAVPNDRDAVEKVRVDHTHTALLAIEVARRIDVGWNPDAVLTHMFSYSIWEPFFKYYHSDGNRFNGISISQFDFHSIILSWFEFYESSERFRRYTASRKNSLLSEDEKRVLNQFLSKRSRGDAQIFRQYAYFDNSRDDNALKQQLAYDPATRNIFLFSNVYWDVGISSCAALFDDVLTWVLQTVALVKSEPSCHLYIKPHPAEVYDSTSSLKGVAQVVRERYPVLPPNVTILDPELKINTYKLFPLIDVGVIFNGTLGLEMALSGIPVISTGRTVHQGLGFSIEPDSMEEYRAALIGEADALSVNRDQLELFAYFYFIRTLIPWRLTKQAYSDAFDGFLIDGLEDLEPGSDPYLDHICNCILDPANTVVEAWPDRSINRDSESAGPQALN